MAEGEKKESLKSSREDGNKEKQGNGFGINPLTNKDILPSVLKWLSAEELLKTGSVCKLWESVASQSNMWARFGFKDKADAKDTFDFKSKVKNAEYYDYQVIDDLLKDENAFNVFIIGNEKPSFERSSIDKYKFVSPPKIEFASRIFFRTMQPKIIVICPSDEKDLEDALDLVHSEYTKIPGEKPVIVIAKTDLSKKELEVLSNHKLKEEICGSMERKETPYLLIDFENNVSKEEFPLKENEEKKLEQIKEKLVERFNAEKQRNENKQKNQKKCKIQ